jgi:hypothetical protein
VPNSCHASACFVAKALESLPSSMSALRPARGKHKTHKNRECCKSKHGIKDFCKNKFNYELRKLEKAAKES